MAGTLFQAEQYHAIELKRLCLAFAARNLQAVMATQGYRRMDASSFKFLSAAAGVHVLSCQCSSRSSGA